MNLLKDIPKGERAYNTLYSDIMNRIEEQQPSTVKRAKLAILWVCRCQDISRLALGHALAIDEHDGFSFENVPDVDKVIQACKGIIEIDSSSSRDILRLSHKTAFEYFYDRVWPGDARPFLFKSSLRYLTMPCMVKRVLSKSEGTEKPLPFLMCAVREIEGTIAFTTCAHECQDLLRELFQNSQTRTTLAFILGPRRHVQSIESAASATALHMCAAWGVYTLVANFENDINRYTADGSTPLDWAAAACPAHGIYTMELLAELMEPFLINAPEEFIACRQAYFKGSILQDLDKATTPLQTLIRSGELSMLQVLLDRQYPLIYGARDVDRALLMILWMLWRNNTRELILKRAYASMTKLLLWAVNLNFGGGSFIEGLRDYWFSGPSDSFRMELHSGEPRGRITRRISRDELLSGKDHCGFNNNKYGIPLCRPKSVSGQGDYRRLDSMNYIENRMLSDAIEPLSYRKHRKTWSRLLPSFARIRSRSATGHDLASLAAKANFQSSAPLGR